MATDVMSSVPFWLVTIFTLAVALVPFFFIRIVEYHFSENIINNLRQERYQNDYEKKVYVKKLEQMTKATRSIAKFKRLYKDTNVDVDNYADKQMMEMVKFYKTKRKNKVSSLSERQKNGYMIAHKSKSERFNLKSLGVEALKSENMKVTQIRDDEYFGRNEGSYDYRNLTNNASNTNQIQGVIDHSAVNDFEYHDENSRINKMSRKEFDSELVSSWSNEQMPKMVINSFKSHKSKFSKEVEVEVENYGDFVERAENLSKN